jgi:hypothetical protein
MSAPARPPFWAEPLLRWLLPPDRVDDVTGDLLEAYRDDPPQWGGLSRAAWWARQVLGQFLRAYWLFPLALAATLVANDLFNTFRDADGHRLGPNLFGPTLITAYSVAGLLGGWRTRRVAGGLVASTGSHVIGWSLVTCWWTVTTYPFALSQQHNPYWINAWHWSASPGESFMHWIVWDNAGAVVLGGAALLLLSLATGLAGGFIGRMLPGPRRTAHT